MIRLYDFNYNLIAECEHSLFSEWDLKLNGIGSFEGRFSINTEFSKEILSHKFLIITEEENQAVIVSKRISDIVTVYGKTPEWLLSKRMVLPFKTSEIFSGEFKTPEEILIYLLNKAYKEPKKITDTGEEEAYINQNAVCNDFIIPEPCYDKKLTRHFWRNTVNPLSDVICDLCDLMDAGYKLKFEPENRCWRFELVFPKEKNTIFSKSLKNCFDMTFKDSLLDFSGGGYFEIYSSDETEESSYAYIEDIESQGEGMLYWERSFLSASGRSEAENMLLKSKSDETVNFELLGLNYGIDYNLGDVFGVQFEAGDYKNATKRKVIGVSIINSSAEKSIKPVLKEI
ncbi:MAG: hypothetical protein Q4B31_02860 [Clostridia bacterium]|nr:hypothetical protein [Clostridia bacterium]